VSTKGKIILVPRKGGSLQFGDVALKKIIMIRLSFDLIIFPFPSAILLGGKSPRSLVLNRNKSNCVLFAMASSPVSSPRAEAKVMKGVLEMKMTAGLTDSWDSFQCEYSQFTKAFVVKTADGQTDVWTKDVEGAW